MTSIPPNKEISSKSIVYSEHGYDECFEYLNGRGRVEDGIAIGYQSNKDKLVLFCDICYSKYDHQYWDNYELEHDVNRLVLP